MAYFWADFAVWYQYDSSNPQNPAIPPVTGTTYYTNYLNYFLVSDGGVTVQPILMTFNVQATLRNCYKTVIQSLTDWSNWQKIGFNSLYWGLLDYCAASQSEQVTVFSWNPISTNFIWQLWGNA
jgi:hypothetical protein